MSFGVRKATGEEIEWLKAQVDPPGFYLDKFLAMNMKYGAIDVGSSGKAGRLKSSIARAITKKSLQIRVYKRDNVVFLIRNDFDAERGPKG